MRSDIDKVSLQNSRFVAPHEQWDLKASYEINDNFRLKFEITNIEDRPEYIIGDIMIASHNMMNTELLMQLDSPTITNKYNLKIASFYWLFFLSLQYMQMC